MRRFESTQCGRDDVPHVRGDAHLLAAGPSHGDRARCSLLKQKLGRLDHGVCVEAVLHKPVVEHISQRNDGHPLVVRHVGFHHGHLLVLGQSSGRVVERLVEPVGTESTGPFEVEE